jgi:ParB/RepB/Spo0J family partition protein
MEESGRFRSAFDEIVELEVDKLKAPPCVLRPINEEIVSELKRSISNCGVLQPIVVRRSQDSKYEIVFGNHRLEACKRLGFRQIPSVIKVLDDDDAFIARVSENLLRNNYVDPIEESKGYRSLICKGWTINAIARKVGKSDSYISERIGLLDRLSPKLRNEISNGELSPSHAELLSRIHGAPMQIALAGLIKSKRLSVRSLESILHSSALPARIKVEIFSGQCTVRIPQEFVKAMRLEPGQDLYIYKRGGKLILDDPRTCRTKRSGIESSVQFTPCLQATETSHVRKSTPNIA